VRRIATAQRLIWRYGMTVRANEQQQRRRNAMTAIVPEIPLGVN
jgi:hypothetical protein